MSAFSSYTNQSNKQQTFSCLVIPNIKLAFLTDDEHLANAVHYNAQVPFLRGSSLLCMGIWDCFLLHVSCVTFVTLQLSVLIFSCSFIIL